MALMLIAALRQRRPTNPLCSTLLGNRCFGRERERERERERVQRRVKQREEAEDTIGSPHTEPSVQSAYSSSTVTYQLLNMSSDHSIIAPPCLLHTWDFYLYTNTALILSK